jgi:purine-nucleoside phosphorylase
MSTPHNAAAAGEIAKTVLLPGDPLRAKFIAEHYLKDAKLFNSVRNMFGYTGTFNGKKVSVMGSGMGMASLGIYVSELYKFYGVENVVRIGSTGSYDPDCKLYDVIIAEGACTDSNFAHQYNLPGTFSALGSYALLKKAADKAEEMKIRYHVGNIFSSDIFYSASPDEWKKWASMGCLCVEMETYALYCLAAYYHKKALSILTVSDSFVDDKITTAEEREKAFTNMIEVALSLI